MVIVWNTGDATNESTVEFGCGGKPKQIAVGKSYKFVDHGSKKRVQYVHRVVLKGLAAQTECCKYSNMPLIANMKSLLLLMSYNILLYKRK